MSKQAPTAKPYIRPMTGWWRRDPFFVRYMARETTAFGVAAYALILAVGAVRLAQGEAAWNGWLAALQSPASLLLQMPDASEHNRLAVAISLQVVANRERAHPPFDARGVRNVECGHITVDIAPAHGAVAGILNRIAPDERVEWRNAHAHEPVATIPLGERIAEQDIERPHIARLDGERPLHGAWHGVRIVAEHHARPLADPRLSVGASTAAPRRTTAAPVRSSSPTSIT